MVWSEYEQQAWRDVQERKKKWFEKANEDSWARRTGERIQHAADGAGRAVRKVPGADRAAGALTTAATKAQEGLTQLSSRTLREDWLLRAYAKHGVEVKSLRDLRSLDLEKLDRVVHRRRLDLFYAGIAAAEGAAAGAVVTGGEALATVGSTASAGAAAAPGFGAVLATMAADAALLLTLTSRAVADTAMHFGFDPNDPKEQLFIMSVINVGSALTQGAKYTALADLSKLTQALVRSAPWAQLNQFVLAQVARTFAEQFGVRLTKQKLGQLVPVVGIGVGAALNYGVVKNVQDAAYWAYRERLLIEKNPEAADLLNSELAGYEMPAGMEDEPSIEIAEILENHSDGEERDVEQDPGAPPSGEGDNRDA